MSSKQNRDRLRAIMRTLAFSVKSGLHATLNPDDCRFLLALLSRDVVRKTGMVDGALKKMAQQLTDLAQDTISSITDEIRKEFR